MNSLQKVLSRAKQNLNEEEAKTRNDALLFLSKNSDKIIEHLFKLYYFTYDKNNIPHWQHEIFAFLNKSPLMKSTHKPPKQEDIKTALWGTAEGDDDESFLPTYKNIISILNHDYYYANNDYKYITPNNIDAKVLREICNNYIDWLSFNLSKNGMVEEKEVIDKLNNLFKS